MWRKQSGCPSFSYPLRVYNRSVRFSDRDGDTVFAGAGAVFTEDFI